AEGPAGPATVTTGPRCPLRRSPPLPMVRVGLWRWRGEVHPESWPRLFLCLELGFGDLEARFQVRPPRFPRKGLDGPVPGDRGGPVATPFGSQTFSIQL